MSKKQTGTVKWFDADKGYGSILSDTNEEVFLQLRSITAEKFAQYSEGQKVSFTIHETKTGKEARNIQVL